MPNDTPDYQQGATYTAVPLATTTVVAVPASFYAVPCGAYSSLLVKLSSSAAGPLEAWFNDANGVRIGSVNLQFSGVATTYMKVPVLGPIFNLRYAGGTGSVTVYGGQEALPLASIASDGTTIQDGSFVPYLSVSQAATAGTPIALGTTYASGRVWLDWVFSSTVSGYLYYTADSPGGGRPNLYVATSAEAVTLQGTTTAKWQGFVNLPAAPAAWTWVPQVTAASAACNLALVKG